MKGTGKTIKLAVLAGMLVATPAMAGELVVFKADGVGLTPGQTIDDSKPLVLTAGQKVTLLSPSGAIIELEGPFRDPPRAKATRAPDSGVVETLKMLVSAPKTRSGELGTTRDIRDVVQQARRTAQPREPWFVDATRSGNYCLTADAPMVFWRPASDSESEVTVRMGDDGWKAQAVWPAGASRLSPPSAMPVTDGGTYRVEMNGITATARLHILPDSLNSPESRTAWMREKGCLSQLAVMNALQ